MYYVYMIKNSFNDLYAGVTKNPMQRLEHHNLRRGAKFTKRETKFDIVFLEPHATLTDARTREIQIKKWRREKKELLIDRYQRGLKTI